MADKVDLKSIWPRGVLDPSDYARCRQKQDHNNQDRNDRPTAPAWAREKRYSLDLETDTLEGSNGRIVSY
jgi:hypothetical protein